MNHTVKQQCQLCQPVIHILLVGQALKQPTGDAPPPGVGTLMAVAVPLIQQTIVEGKAAEGGGHELKVRRSAGL